MTRECNCIDGRGDGVGCAAMDRTRLISSLCRGTSHLRAGAIHAGKEARWRRE